MKHAVLTGLMAAALSVAATAHAAEPTGETFAHTCAACHGTYGEVQNETFVALRGMNKDEFINSMNAFKNLKRPSSIMSHIAEGYKEADIVKMAEFFESLGTKNKEVAK